MLYEEALSALYACHRYADMPGMIARYRRSSQLPVAVLQQPNALDPFADSTLRDVALAYDVLSRDEVWKADSSWPDILQELGFSQDASNNPRRAILTVLNHATEVLVDQIHTAATTPAVIPNQSVALASGSLSLYYFVGARRVFRTATDAAGRTEALVVPISGTELKKRCDAFRAALQEQKNDKPASDQLYGLLLAGLDLKAAGRLFVSPDGPLNFIPFQALWNGTTERYLIQDHVVTYLTGAVAGGPIAPVDPKSLVLVGNPDGTLPEAENEISQIAAIQGWHGTSPLLNASATLESFRTALNDSGSVHLATHARANEADPNYAYIQFANGERLYSYNLGGLDFRGRAIFLGACETRVAAALPGDDIYGIADAFLTNGAPSVIATLWRVETNSSSAFAQRYYELLANGADPSEAVAGAARDFVDRKILVKRNSVEVAADAPAYWAAYSHLVSAAAFSPH